MIRFGPSGNSESFYEKGHKSSVEAPEWLASIGLSAYEYQCSKGVNISEGMARQLGEQALKNDVFLSIHAPYYINMASVEEEKRINSRVYIVETMRAAKWMGAKRVVVHPGSCSKIDRRIAMDLALQVLRATIKEADELGLSDVSICPEVLGKLNQLGSLEEILELCSIDERLIPTIDFGHIHARGMGCLNTAEDFGNILERIENALGYERLKSIHSHFSRIEFTAGGEKKHWTLADCRYGPEFEPLAEALYKKRMEPVIICESRGNMAEDALQLMRIYEKVAKGEK